MQYRTRYRIHPIPFFVVSLSALTLLAVLTVHPVSDFLERQMHQLPWITIGVAALAPLAFAVWYALSYAEVNRGVLRVRSIRAKQQVDLRRLVAAEVYAKKATNSKRSQHKGLVLQLEDEAGRQLWMPLNVWSQEDLVMARVLRGTVERRVRIDGEPMLVRRFSALLDSYKSWDRQQAAA